MGGGSCRGLPTKGNSRALFTCEKGYVTTQSRDTNVGGVRHHHNKLISYPHVLFSMFSYFLYQSLTFFILLYCVLMTLNISLIQIVYCIQSCVS